MWTSFEWTRSWVIFHDERSYYVWFLEVFQSKDECSSRIKVWKNPMLIVHWFEVFSEIFWSSLNHAWCFWIKAHILVSLSMNLQAKSFARVESSMYVLAWVWYCQDSTKLSSKDLARAKWILLEKIFFLRWISKWISKPRLFDRSDLDLVMFPPFGSILGWMIWVSSCPRSLSSCVVLILSL